MKKYKITLFGVKNTTKIIAEHLYNNGIIVDLIISIDTSVLINNDISDYINLENTAKLIGADYYCIKHYSLKQLEDDFFQQNQFELGIVYGWQRLIPDNILNKFNSGIFGFHASYDLLPQGRGRSPLNWGIILGKQTLYNHLFKYTHDADAGDIYSITKFSINPHDTILTLLYKSLLIAKTEIIKLIQDVNLKTLRLTPQHGGAYCLPKRSPKDSLLYFETMPTTDIINLIRASSKPFSGAYCFTNKGTKIIIFEAWEFDGLIDFVNYIPGDVIDNIYNMPIIKTRNSSIILKDYSGATLQPHDKLLAEKL